MFSIFLATFLYAIVGGPFVGKTTLINALQEEGELIARETAIDFILEEQAKGVEAPWEHEGFEIKLFDEKIRRENLILEEAKQSNRPRVFLDRGLHDSLAYIKLLKKEESTEAKYIVAKLKELDASSRYTAVFYVEPYNGSLFQAHTSEARHETTELALALSSSIKEAYEDAGFHLITVPPHMSPEERALFILEKTHHFEKVLETKKESFGNM